MDIKDFYDSLEDRINNSQDKVIAIDEKGNSYSFGDIGLLSGKLNAFLKDKSIGKNEFVIIHMERSALIPAIAFALLRAGYCYSVVEKSDAVERFAFIKEDLNARIVINEDIMHEILRETPDYDFPQTDLHDLADAVYTSGTTGKPKGILHERGSYNNEMNRWLKLVLKEEINVISSFMTSNMGFIALQSNMVVMVQGVVLHFLDYVTIRNMEKLYKYLDDNHITSGFFSPGYYKKWHEYFGDNRPSALTSLFISSEGASYVPLYKGVKLINVYASSEIRAFCCSQQIDNTEASSPVGPPLADNYIMLLDEEGSIQDIAEGNEGEICVNEPYLRGYRNLDEENKKHFRDGLFHTGDYGRYRNDGIIEVVGRIDNMVKINGNRVEPEEISRQINGYPGISECCTIVDDSLLYAYYVSNTVIDEDELSTYLKLRLPSYMLPNAYMALGSMPRNRNGKIDKFNLPKIKEKHSAYAAPQTQTERVLCGKVAECLKAECVGISDNFIALGGNSLLCIAVIAHCAECGYTVPYEKLYSKCSLQDVAACMTITKDIREDDSLPDKNRHYLLPMQEQIARENVKGQADTANYINFYVPLPEDIDVHKLNAAIAEVVRHTFSLQMRIVTEGEQLYQVYAPELLGDENYISEKVYSGVEECSEDFFSVIDLTRELPFRLRLANIKGEFYLFATFHHSCIDGDYLVKLTGNIERLYNGFPITDTDSYFHTISAFEAMRSHRDYTEKQSEIRERFKNLEEANERMHRNIVEVNGIKPKKCNGKRMYETEIDFSNVAMPTERIINAFSGAFITLGDGTDVTMQITNLFRYSAGFASSSGCLISDIPVFIRHDMTSGEIREAIENDLRKYSALEYSYGNPYDWVVLTIQPESIANTEFFGKKLCFYTEDIGIKAVNYDAESTMSLAIYTGKTSVIEAQYKGAYFDKITVDRLAELFEKEFEDIK